MGEPFIGVQWEGWDGSVWDLRNGPDLFITDAGITGLLQFESEVFTRTSALLDGQVVTGWRAKERAIVLPIDVSSSISAVDWYSRQKAFNRTMRPDRNGLLTITDPLGEQRSIEAHADGSVGQNIDVDPTINMGMTTVFELEADDPWYKGPTTIQQFVDASSSARSFYDGPGPTKAGPPFYLGTGVVTGEAFVENLGDYDAWPIWNAWGPFFSLYINVAGQVISSDTPVGDGYRLQIDTRQNEKVAWLDQGDGTPRQNVTDTLDLANFARIPDGARIPVKVLLGGNGTASLELTPRYFRGIA